MIYLLKITLISGIFLLFYHAFLEMNGSHRFNRVYLLSTALFSLIIPLIPIGFSSQSLQFDSYVLSKTEFFNNETVQIAVVKPHINTNFVFKFIYFLITIFLAIRIIFRSYFLFNISKKHEHIQFGSNFICLVREDIEPFSFWNTIFINKADYENALIPAEVLCHENIHISQKHTLDIFILEGVRMFFWPNPLWIIYKKAIQLNHEFLADEEVVKQFNDISRYQKLVFESIRAKSLGFFVSPFNYLSTKKRLIMLMKPTSSLSSRFHQILLIPLLLILIIVLFGKQAVSQQLGYSVPEQSLNSNGGDSLSSEKFEEFQNEIKRSISESILKNGKKALRIDNSKMDAVKLIKLYKLMSVDQKARANKTIPWIINPPKLPAKISPTIKQFKEWQDPLKYGVWVDGKRIKNNKLKDLNPKDFVYFTISKLYANARVLDGFDFQVFLVSPSYFITDYVESGLYSLE